MRGRGDEIGVFHRRRMNATGDETGDVRHVHEEVSAHALGDLAHALEVDDTRICGSTGGDHLWLLTLRDFGKFIVVDAFIALADAILAELVEAA